MEIPFRKIGATPQEFTFERDGITLSGTLSANERNLVKLSGVIKGTLSVPCDLCAENFDTILDEELTILLSDGVFHGSDDAYDVIEFFDGIINIDTLLSSELELHRSDYHSCPACKS
jgi:hypothetical protein